MKVRTSAQSLRACAVYLAWLSVSSAGCDGPTIRLPVREGAKASDAGTGTDAEAGPSDDDDDDDDLDDDVVCASDNPCRDATARICSPQGICVECVSDGDCAGGSACDAKGECEDD